MDNPTTTARWSVEDYVAAGITLSGGRKLADSAVAPLVAQARGYETIEDQAGAKRIAALIYTSKGARAEGMRLRTMTNNGNDFTVIPWFSVADVFRLGSAAISAATQVRPSRPLEDAEGRIRKYEFLSGHDTPIDLHPAVPMEWFNSARRVLFTEGVLKGDSALTAQMLDAGITASELAADKSLNAEGARKVLGALLTRIPEEDRVGILEFSGVSNWHQNPEWNAFNLRDRDALVAFDGDLRTNIKVWRQAEKLFDFLADSKKANPILLDLGGAEAMQYVLNAGQGEMKVGLDDFLSKVAGWSAVLHLTEPTLPAEPKGDEFSGPTARVDDWRISADGTEAEKFAKIGAGDMASFDWIQGVVRLGGRIISNTTLRTSTDPNVEVGTANDKTVITSGTGEVVIEVKWRDVDDNVQTALVKGPQLLLSSLPQDWARIAPDAIAPAITLHPDWPPRGAKGEGWLSAVKANRAEEIVAQEGWDTMGYVPTASGHPVFIVGESVLGASIEDERNNHPGVTEETLAKSSVYGVKDTWHELVEVGDDIDAWKAQIAADIRIVVERFTNGQAWRNPAYAPILLACSLRPTIPTSTSVQLFISGGPGSGKSWAASFVMGFWQATPGSWSEVHLPGSANDTPAAIEYARARTPIWVVDDVAPGASRQESERMDQAIDSIVRQGFNNTGKRRSSADGKQQKVSIPRALTVYTAENPRETLSIRQRAVELRFKRTDTLNDGAGASLISELTRNPENPMSRLTAAMIRFWLNLDLTETPLPYMRPINLEGLDLNSWSGKQRLARRIRNASKADIEDLLSNHYGVTSGESARRAQVFSEMMLTLDVLYSLGTWAGMDPDDEILQRLEGDPGDENSIHGALLKYAAEDLADFRSQSNSRSLLEAIKSILVGGYAHLQNPVDPGMPPLPDTHWNHRSVNQALGWSYDSTHGNWVPRGTPIGDAGQPVGANDGEWIAAINPPLLAFNLAQQRFPSLVPHGQKSAASWGQVWNDEGGVLVSDRYTAPENRGTTVKVRLIGREDFRTRAVPVKLQVLLGVDESALASAPPEGR